MTRRAALTLDTMTGAQIGFIAGMESPATRRNDVRRVRQDLARRDRARRARLTQERGLGGAPKTWRTEAVALLRHLAFHLQASWEIDRRV